MTRLVVIGGSDAGISAALRARELDPNSEVIVVLADTYPNFSICGIPYFVSGDVPDWRDLAHRTIADLEATGMQLQLDTTARRIDVEQYTLFVTEKAGAENVVEYDMLVIETGAVSVRPPIDGLATLGAADGVHLLVHQELVRHGVEVLTETAVKRIAASAALGEGRLEVEASTASGETVTRSVDMVLVVVGVRPDSDLAAAAGATRGAKSAIAVDRLMQTSLPDIYAAGDCVVTHHRLLSEAYLPLGTTASTA